MSQQASRQRLCLQIAGTYPLPQAYTQAVRVSRADDKWQPRTSRLPCCLSLSPARHPMVCSINASARRRLRGRREFICTGRVRGWRTPGGWPSGAVIMLLHPHVYLSSHLPNLVLLAGTVDAAHHRNHRSVGAVLPPSCDRDAANLSLRHLARRPLPRPSHPSCQVHQPCGTRWRPY